MKRLVLLGGGHAQVKVLTDFAASPLTGWDVALVTPYRRQIYSGMLPGWVAGHYPLDACALPLDALAARAHIGFHQTAGIELDLTRNEVLCADGARLPFDLLSIDTGPEPSLADLPGAREHALPVRPIEQFIAAWPTLLERMLTHRRTFDLVIIGAGAAGVELAFAAEHRCATAGAHHVRFTLVGNTQQPLPGSPERIREHIARLLGARGMTWLGSRRATCIRPEHVEFLEGDVQSFDACLIVTGAAAPRWPSESGLMTNEHGFIRVDPTLRSLSHPHIFAAGDVAAYHDERPKSGVFAVRAGPVLAYNLRAAATGGSLQPWTPQRRALYLISTGERYALASWGAWSVGGRWVWRWKDLIDRRFVRQYSA